MGSLVLSVRALTPAGRASIEGNSGADHGSCRFCAVRVKPREPSLFLDADGACPYCRLARRLDLPSIDDEAVLIWLPEFTQAALIAIVRECYLRLARCGLQQVATPEAPVSSTASMPLEAREAVVAIATLMGRRAEVQARLGSSSPKALGQALLRLKSEAYADRARRLHGVRLMPLWKA